MSGKMLDHDMKISEIVKKDYGYAAILHEKGIDFCCGGNKTLKQACTEKGIVTDELIQELEKLQHTQGEKNSFSESDIESLVQYIVETHHKYTKAHIPIIKKYATKVANVHGSRHPETVEIEQVFGELADEMVPHMQKEEIMLFPYIKKLSKAKNTGKMPDKPVFGSLADFISSMVGEHDHSGDCLHRLESLTDNFNPPQDACQTYRILFSELEEFTSKTMEHVHLENNVLFPASVELERDLIKSK